MRPPPSLLPPPPPLPPPGAAAGPPASVLLRESLRLLDRDDDDDDVPWSRRPDVIRVLEGAMALVESGDFVVNPELSERGNRQLRGNTQTSSSYWRVVYHPNQGSRQWCLQIRRGGGRRGLHIVVIKEYFATELEAAVAHDVFCDLKRIKCLRNFVRREEPAKDLTDPQVLEEEEERLASIDAARPKKKPVTMPAFLQTMREKCATISSSLWGVERQQDAAPKCPALDCSTYSDAWVHNAVLRHNAQAGGNFRRWKDFELSSPEADCVNAELAEAKTSPAAPLSKRGKAVYHSIAALRRRVGPHIAEAVEQLMAGCTGGASPIRIQINLYSDDDDDSAIHSLHLDPIKPGETVIVWSFGMPARLAVFPRDLVEIGQLPAHLSRVHENAAVLHLSKHVASKHVADGHLPVFVRGMPVASSPSPISP
ncbi:hypothetical protein NFJ02_11g05310 [Pycnococcus provasolii]